MSRLINQSLREHFGMVVQTRMFIPDSGKLNIRKPVVGSSPSPYISTPPIESNQENMSQIEIVEYDIERIKEGFNQWIDKWNDSLIEKEFNDPHERGTVTRTEDDDSLKYSFTTEFNFSIKRLNPDREEDDEDTKGNK